MSFYINSTELKEAYFNGSEVSSIYYNGTLVWESGYPWVGWNNATWEDIYNLCKAKQNGEIDAWPSDIVLGATKTISLSTAVLGSTSTTMYLIGIDIDGDGILTFQGDTLANTTTWSSASSTTWPSSTIRSQCINFYHFCEAKPYIKALNKGYIANPTSSSTVAFQSENVFVLSVAEIFLNASTSGEFTEGVDTTYSYKPKLKKQSWLRSRSATNASNRYIRASDTSYAGYAAYNTSQYFSPAFAIG